MYMNSLIRFFSAKSFHSIQIFSVEWIQLGYSNKICWSRWHQWSIEARGLAVFCFFLFIPLLMRRHHFIVILERRPYFIGYMREETPFYWVSLGGGWWIFLCPKLCWRLAGASFYGPSSTWRAGRLDQIILFVWP